MVLSLMRFRNLERRYNPIALAGDGVRPAGLPLPYACSVTFYRLSDRVKLGLGRVKARSGQSIYGPVVVVRRRTNAPSAKKCCLSSPDRSSVPAS
jgi:hypothetical protein